MEDKNIVNIGFKPLSDKSYNVDQYYKTIPYQINIINKFIDNICVMKKLHYTYDLYCVDCDESTLRCCFLEAITRGGNLVYDAESFRSAVLDTLIKLRYNYIDVKRDIGRKPYLQPSVQDFCKDNPKGKYLLYIMSEKLFVLCIDGEIDPEGLKELNITRRKIEASKIRDVFYPLMGDIVFKYHQELED